MLSNATAPNYKTPGHKNERKYVNVMHTALLRILALSPTAFSFLGQGNAG